MKYHLAKTIQSLIFDLDSTWEQSDYGCAIERTYPHINDSNYSVYLFSRGDYDCAFFELCAFAQSLDTLCNHFTLRFGKYNIGTTDDNYVKAIIIR